MKKEYILKHKNISIYTFYMDDESFKVLEAGKILEKEHLPFNMQDIETPQRLLLQTEIWLGNRGLPDSRYDLINIKKLFNEDSAKTLAIKSLGLNLTDHYWIHKAEENKTWENVNHFTNSFDTLILPDNYKAEIDANIKSPSPNLCVDGSIVKRWLINNENERILLKGSRYSWMQEPYNEKIASLIMKEFKIPHVNYELKYTKDLIPFSECKCMVNTQTEYINAWWILYLEKYNAIDEYKHYINLCIKNGIDNAKEMADTMIAIDFLLGNEDRHKGNFGIIRNAETLKWEKIADIFDNGNSLLYNCPVEDLNDIGIDSMCKSFEGSNRLALELIDYPEWWKNADRNLIIEIVDSVLSTNQKMKNERKDRILELTKERVSVFKKHISKLGVKK